MRSNAMTKERLASTAMNMSVRNERLFSPDFPCVDFIIFGGDEQRRVRNYPGQAGPKCVSRKGTKLQQKYEQYNMD